MGKIFVLSVTDHEEYILSRIMEIIAAEPEQKKIKVWYLYFPRKTNITGTTSTVLQ